MSVNCPLEGRAPDRFVTDFTPALKWWVGKDSVRKQTHCTGTGAVVDSQGSTCLGLRAGLYFIEVSQLCVCMYICIYRERDRGMYSIAFARSVEYAPL